MTNEVQVPINSLSEDDIESLSGGVVNQILTFQVPQMGHLSKKVSSSADVMSILQDVLPIEGDLVVVRRRSRTRIGRFCEWLSRQCRRGSSQSSEQVAVLVVARVPVANMDPIDVQKPKDMLTLETSVKTLCATERPNSNRVLTCISEAISRKEPLQRIQASDGNLQEIVGIGSFKRVHMRFDPSLCTIKDCPVVAIECRQGPLFKGNLVQISYQNGDIEQYDCSDNPHLYETLCQSYRDFDGSHFEVDKSSHLKGDENSKVLGDDYWSSSLESSDEEEGSWRGIDKTGATGNFKLDKMGMGQSHNREEYDRHIYGMFVDTIQSAILQGLIKKAPVVLDAGCGLGHMMVKLLTDIEGSQVYGGDYSQDSVSYAYAQCKEAGYGDRFRCFEHQLDVTRNLESMCLGYGVCPDVITFSGVLAKKVLSSKEDAIRALE